MVKKDSYEVPAVFRLLQEKGGLEDKMMYNTYNMGLGMLLAIEESRAEAALNAIRAAGEIPYVVGHTEAGEKGVTIC